MCDNIRKIVSLLIIKKPSKKYYCADFEKNPTSILLKIRPKVKVTYSVFEISTLSSYTCLFISSLNTNCWTSLQTLTVQLYKQLYKHPVWIQKVWIQTRYVFLLGGSGWGWWGDVRPAPSPSHPNNTTPYRPTLLTIGVSLWAPLYYSLGCSIWWGLRNSNLLTNQFINVSFHVGLQARGFTTCLPAPYIRNADSSDHWA